MTPDERQHRADTILVVFLVLVILVIVVLAALGAVDMDDTRTEDPVVPASVYQHPEEEP